MNTLNVLQALEVMKNEYGCPMNRNALYAWIRCGKCPFGVYIKKEGKSQGRYVVFRNRMEEYFKPKHGVHNPLIITQERSVYFA